MLRRFYAGKRMAPQVGLEPTTLRLTAGCSAIELLRSGVRHVHHSIAGEVVKTLAANVHWRAWKLRKSAET
jgi:hypothetical protein